MSTASPENLSEKRAAVILKVRSGLITAKEGAKLLSVSRKSYFQWEERGLRGMLSALEDKPPGRPAKVRDGDREALLMLVVELEERLLVAEQTLEVRKLLLAWEEKKDPDKGKKSPKRKQSRS
jgi:transposase